MSIIGTSDKMVIKDWYSGDAGHVEEFKTFDGQVQLDTQVEALVNAMAAYAVPASSTLAQSTLTA